MTKRQLLFFFFKWKESIFSLLMLVVFLVTLFVYILPPKYTGKAKVLIERNRSPVMRSDVSIGLEMVEVINTEIEIVLSHTVMASVVDKLTPFDRTKKDTFLGNRIKNLKSVLKYLGLTIHMEPRDRWIKNFTDRVDVKQVVHSNILDITYKDKNPAWAAEVVNSITDAYIEHHFNIYSPAGSAKIYMSRMKDILNKLETKRQALTRFKKGISVSAIEESKKGLVQSIASIRDKVTEYRIELADVLARYEPGHREIKILNSKIRQLTASIDKINKELNILEIQKDEISNMEKEIVSEEKTYEFYKNKSEEAYLTQIGNVEISNVRVVDYSAIPARPTHSRLFYIALSVVAGFIISISIAFIREYFDRQITEPGIVEQILGAPEIGSIEKFRNFSIPWKYSIRKH